jgi:hypothetical protein
LLFKYHVPYWPTELDDSDTNYERICYYLYCGVRALFDALDDVGLRIPEYNVLRGQRAYYEPLKRLWDDPSVQKAWPLLEPKVPEKYVSLLPAGK